MALFKQDKEEAAFWAWVDSVYGHWDRNSLMAQYTFTDYKKSPQYAYWVSQGKPSATTALATTETTPTQTATTTTDTTTALTGIPSFPTEAPPTGYHWEFDTTGGEWIPVPGELTTTQQGMTTYEQAQFQLDQTSAALEQARGTREEAGLQRQFELDKQTLAQQQAQYIAGLQANPADWIEAWFMQNVPQQNQFITTPSGDYMYAPGSLGQGAAITNAALSNVPGNQQAGLSYYGVNTEAIRPNEMMMTNDELAQSVEDATLAMQDAGYTASDVIAHATEVAGGAGTGGLQGITEEIPAEVQEAYNTLTSAQNELAKRDTLAQLQGQMESGVYAPQVRPTAPPTPPWLAKLIPGSTVGEPISRQPIKVPSAQQFQWMPYTERQGLQGYLNYAKGTGAPSSLTDLEELIAQSLPQSRRATRTRAFQV